MTALRRAQTKLSYANVMSTIAVFLALTTGAAYAHGLIGTKDLKNKAVTPPKLAQKAVKAGKIAPAAVKGSKIRDGAVTSSKLGPIITRTETVTVSSGTQAGIGSACAEGELLIGGGAQWANFSSNQALVHSLPVQEDNMWFARGVNNTAGDRTLRAIAYCLQ
jgi:hypothetical protein